MITHIRKLFVRPLILQTYELLRDVPERWNDTRNEAYTVKAYKLTFDTSQEIQLGKDLPNCDGIAIIYTDDYVTMSPNTYIKPKSIVAFRAGVTLRDTGGVTLTTNERKLLATALADIHTKVEAKQKRAELQVENDCAEELSRLLKHRK